MTEAIGQSLPIAVGVLISPMPIVAMVLMLVSRRATANGLAFLLGWVVGIYLLGAVVVVVAGAGSTSSGEPPAWAAWVKIVLGVLLLLLTARTWTGRPKPGESPPAPKWMASIESVSPPRSSALGFLLSAVNPKNLLLVVSGAAAIASATPSRSDQLVALAVFTVVASIGVAAPLVIYVAMGGRATQVLDELRGWMVAHNAVIMATLLLVIGVKMIGDGISAL
jgi:threonine/homoserine/homoserine lactone efflux protein